MEPPYLYTYAMGNDYKHILGKVIAAKQNATGLTKSQFSSDAGINRLTLRNIENGVANPSLEMLLKITRVLDVSLANVFVECERNLLNQDNSQTQTPETVTVEDSETDTYYILTKL